MLSLYQNIINHTKESQRLKSISDNILFTSNVVSKEECCCDSKTKNYNDVSCYKKK